MYFVRARDKKIPLQKTVSRAAQEEEKARETAQSGQASGEEVSYRILIDMMITVGGYSK